MEFSDYQCPVCKQSFKNGDDVVVCPECGAPHHRECYEESGHCFFEDRHSDGFSFENTVENGNRSEETGDYIVCPRCKFENEKTSFYCNNCGFPLNEKDRGTQNTSQSDSGGQYSNPYSGGFQGMPFGVGFGPGSANMFDPLAGMDGEEQIADNVKVSEAAKFIGKTTQYFLPVFKNIRDKRGFRFNFSAMIFAESYFLYRKITVLGVIVSLFLLATTVASAAVMMTPEWNADYQSLMEMIQSGVNVSVFSKEFAFMYLPLGIQGARLIVRVLCGIFANKLYYKHCEKQINRIKNDSTVTDLNKTLETKGGVNLPLAVSFYAAGFVVTQICNFISSGGSFML